MVSFDATAIAAAFLEKFYSTLTATGTESLSKLYASNASVSFNDHPVATSSIADKYAAEKLNEAFFDLSNGTFKVVPVLDSCLVISVSGTVIKNKEIDNEASASFTQQFFIIEYSAENLNADKKQFFIISDVFNISDFTQTEVPVKPKPTQKATLSESLSPPQVEQTESKQNMDKHENMPPPPEQPETIKQSKHKPRAKNRNSTKIQPVEPQKSNISISTANKTASYASALRSPKAAAAAAAETVDTTFEQEPKASSEVIETTDNAEAEEEEEEEAAAENKPERLPPPSQNRTEAYSSRFPRSICLKGTVPKISKEDITAHFKSLFDTVSVKGIEFLKKLPNQPQLCFVEFETVEQANTVLEHFGVVGSEKGETVIKGEKMGVEKRLPHNKPGGGGFRHNSGFKFGPPRPPMHRPKVA